jgi:small subunit ribosomal protein S7
MSRRRKAERREAIPDAKYGDAVLGRFMNCLMYDGKKAAAEQIVYGALSAMEAKAKADPVKMFHSALENVAPAIEVRSRRVGGATYQVPVRLWRSAGSSPPRAAATNKPWKAACRQN